MAGELLPEESADARRLIRGEVLELIPVTSPAHDEP